MSAATELELPLGEGNPVAEQRVGHLAAVPGITPRVAERLIRRFHSLRGIYDASGDALSEVVGPVVAARIRWFLDAPLEVQHPFTRRAA